jgi:integrase
VNCLHCGTPVPPGSRRDRLYCAADCRQQAYRARRRAGVPHPRWQHPALGSGNPSLRSAAALAAERSEAHGWSSATLNRTLDGLTVLLAERTAGEPVTLSEVRARTSRPVSRARVAEVLAGLDLLRDDTTLTIRAWIERRTAELPAGFANDVRAWLLVLLDGDARSRPRSPSSLYVYYGAVTPLLQSWSASHDHLREITAADLTTALEPLRGARRRNTVVALRSLFRFAKKHHLVFTDPAASLKTEPVAPGLVPMTEAEIRAVEQIAVHPAQRLIIALLAVHAARPSAIQNLLLDDVDLPNRRITLAGHPQRLGELTARTLRTWLDHRQATWPHTPNRHLLISGATSLGLEPITKNYFKHYLRNHGIGLDRIRQDRVLHEALTTGADPLHLSLVFNLSHATASRYTGIAQQLLDSELERPGQHRDSQIPSSRTGGRSTHNRP